MAGAKGGGGLGTGLVSGIVAGGIFLLFWLVLGLPFAASLAAGVLSFGGVLAIARGLGKAGEASEGPGLGHYVDKDLARKVVEDARKAAAELESLGGSMEPGSVKSKFRGLALGLGRIGDDVALDPRDAVAASLFLSNYGAAALRMARLYLGLAKGSRSRAEDSATLAKLDKVLDRMLAATELELSSLRADEWDALRMEIDFMEAGEPDPPAAKGQALGGL